MLRVGYAALLAVMLTGLPLFGVVLAGIPIAPYLEFPPRTAFVAHAPFSWTVFVSLAVMILMSLGLLLSRFLPPPSRRLSADLHRSVDRSRATAFPWWGRIAVLWTAAWWLLAWTRLPWMTSLQEHTFTPLWLGYIVVINAWTYRRTGHCMMLHRPRYFLSLFPLSAVFWWFFEYLNRFVQNWYYVDVADLSPLEYALRATVSFSTVLPAVLGTAEWLSSFAPFTAGLARCRPIDWTPGRRARRVTLCAAAVGLAGLGLWPDYLFPLVWVAPLLLIVCVQDEWGEMRGPGEISGENWGSMGQVALAALLCGFFWEMWNFKSLAHWEYAVPFVQQFHVFEMPLLGYAGYVPFGLECLVVADACLARKYSGGVAYYEQATVISQAG